MKVTDDHGCFIFERVAPGDYRLEGSSAGFMTYTRDLRVTRLAGLRRRIVMSLNATIEPCNGAAYLEYAEPDRIAGKAEP